MVALLQSPFPIFFFACSIKETAKKLAMETENRAASKACEFKGNRTYMYCVSQELRSLITITNHSHKPTTPTGNAGSVKTPQSGGGMLGTDTSSLWVKMCIVLSCFYMYLTRAFSQETSQSCLCHDISVHLWQPSSEKKKCEI